jgi:hypothetical protein
MTSKAQERFNNDYLYVRKELVAGRNPFVTSQSMKDWIQTRVDAVVNQMVKERWRSVQRNYPLHAERELEAYHHLMRWNGETEDDE